MFKSNTLITLYQFLTEIGTSLEIVITWFNFCRKYAHDVRAMGMSCK
jgi:hypothetical protein